MKRASIGILMFRFLLILTVLGVGFDAPPRFQSILFALTAGLGLWLFSALCLDASAIRTALEGSETNTIPLGNSNPASIRPSSGASPLVMDTFSPRKLGDRLFKADESKTCKSCQSFEPEGPLCRLDDESLAGITITAVGCQHWSPGLKVAGGASQDEP